MADKKSTNAASKEEVIKIMMKDIEEHFMEETNKDKMRKIYDILAEYNELDSIEKYKKVKRDIIESIEDNEEELLKFLIGEEFEYKSGISFKLNKIKKEASLFDIDKCFNNFTVPRTIQYNNENYLVLSIIRCEKLSGTLQFEENSAVHTFYKNAFRYSEVKEIYIPANLRKIKEGCFCSTRELKKIKISPNNDRFMYQNEQCLVGKTDEKSDNYDVLLFARKDISEATIPSNIKIISSYAFNKCYNLLKVTIEENSKLENIGECAFSNSKIEEIFIPSNVSIISDYAFNSCRNLRKVIIEENSKLEIIGKNAFSFSNIETFFIPANLRIIYDEAFYYCTNLREVTIEENSKLEIIGKSAFTSSTIEEIFIPSNVSIISDSAFNKCTNLREVTIEENSKLEIIGKYAFSDSNIEEIFIPANLREIKENCFRGTNKLKNIKISPKNDRFMYQSDQYLLGKIDEKSDNYDVFLFARRDISEAKIQSNIKIIGKCAFYGCANLRKVAIEENSKLENIGEFAFSDSNIEEIFIPSNVSTISDSAFDFCKNLRKVTIEENSKLEIIGKRAFSSSSIEEIFIPSNVSIIALDAFSWCYELKIVEISEESQLGKLNNLFLHLDKNIIIMVPAKIK